MHGRITTLLTTEQARLYEVFCHKMDRIHDAFAMDLIDEDEREKMLDRVYFEYVTLHELASL